MREYAYYIARINAIKLMVKGVFDNVPCFVDMHSVEAGVVKLVVNCREEDIAYIERELAPYV